MSLPGSFVSTSAGRVFVHRAGRGAPLCLLHGWTMSHWYFRPVMDALANEREVFAIDLPGYGESDNPRPSEFKYTKTAFADVVAELLSALGVAQADVLGHSMGGGVAVAFALAHPDRVARLIAVDAAWYPVPVRELDMMLALTPGIGELLFKNLLTRGRYRRVNRAYSVRDPRLIDDELIDYYWTRVCRPGGREAMHATMRGLTVEAGDHDPVGIVAPALIVWGDEDRLIPIEYGKRLHRAIDSSRFEVVPACGHTPFIERPQEFLRLVLPFLAEGARPLRVTG